MGGDVGFFSYMRGGYIRARGPMDGVNLQRLAHPIPPAAPNIGCPPDARRETLPLAIKTTYAPGFEKRTPTPRGKDPFFLDGSAKNWGRAWFLAIKGFTPVCNNEGSVHGQKIQAGRNGVRSTGRRHKVSVCRVDPVRTKKLCGREKRPIKETRGFCRARRSNDAADIDFNVSKLYRTRCISGPNRTWGLILLCLRVSQFPLSRSY